MSWSPTYTTWPIDGDNIILPPTVAPVSNRIPAIGAAITLAVSPVASHCGRPLNIFQANSAALRTSVQEIEGLTAVGEDFSSTQVHRPGKVLDEELIARISDVAKHLASQSQDMPEHISEALDRSLFDLL